MNFKFDIEQINNSVFKNNVKLHFVFLFRLQLLMVTCKLLLKNDGFENSITFTQRKNYS